MKTIGAQKMKMLKKLILAAKLTFGIATVAYAHPFIGVGILGGPVFPVASSAQSAPPLPVYPRATDSGPAPLPLDAPQVTYASPVIGNLAAIMGHANNANVQGSI